MSPRENRPYLRSDLTEDIRHADAARVSVQIDRCDGLITCVVADGQALRSPSVTRRVIAYETGLVTP